MPCCGYLHLLVVDAVQGRELVIVIITVSQQVAQIEQLLSLVEHFGNHAAQREDIAAPATSQQNAHRELERARLVWRERRVGVLRGIGRWRIVLLTNHETTLTSEQSLLNDALRSEIAGMTVLCIEEVREVG